MKLIAICTDIDEFNNDNVLNSSFAKNYIGASYYSLLGKHFTERGFLVHTGDVALRLVGSGEIRASDVYVLSDMHSRHGKKLVQRGGRALASFCLETPLVATFFYDDLYCMRFTYPKYFLVSSFNLENDDGVKFFRINFPALEERDLHHRDKYLVKEKINKVSLLAANKWFDLNKPFIRNISPRQVYNFLYMLYRYSASYVRKNFNKCDLHDERLSLIFYLAEKERLVIGGQGWGDEKFYPRKHRKHFKKTKDHLCLVGRVNNKFDFISKYRLTIAFENTVYMGYVTEKLVHALYCGVVPVYSGAEDVNDIISSDLFINYKKCTKESLSMIINDEKLIESYLFKIKNLSNDFFHKFTDAFLAKLIIQQIEKDL